MAMAVAGISAARAQVASHPDTIQVASNEPVRLDLDKLVLNNPTAVAVIKGVVAEYNRRLGLPPPK